MDQKFRPVIIGTDVNAYNVARSFHMAYGVTSKVFGSMELVQVKYSRICDTTTVSDFYKDDVMVKTLIDYAKIQTDTILILFAASENYVHRIFANYESLSSYYEIPYAPPEMGLYYSDKMNFYKSCEENNLAYPKVQVVNGANYQRTEIKLSFPLILKPIESADYFMLDFVGKEKVYILEDMRAYDSVLSTIYEHGYQHELLLQELISGTLNDEYVVNVYCDKHSKVRLLSLGQIIMDHPDPELRGNYMAIASAKMTDKIEALYTDIITYLEAIHFKGLANFDFKWDASTQQFMALDFNLRQGRSSFFSVVSGANYAVSVVDDIFDKSRDMIIGDKPFVWLECTEDFFRESYAHVNPKKYSELSSIKNIENTLTYDKDDGDLRKHLISQYLHKNDQLLMNTLEKKNGA